MILLLSVLKRAADDDTTSLFECVDVVGIKLVWLECSLLKINHINVCGDEGKTSEGVHIACFSEVVLMLGCTYCPPHVDSKPKLCTTGGPTSRTRAHCYQIITRLGRLWAIDLVALR